MTHSDETMRNTQEFLAVAPQFKLGQLVTEQPHPLTGDLSDLAKHDIPKGLKILHAIDSATLEVLSHKIDAVISLSGHINRTLQAGNRIFLCGCGSTGRLSLAIETIWRSCYNDSSLKDRVVAFMAGGDVALVRSIENFEDHPEYGARQLADLGFLDGDLLISCTEGGETPFVIGATEYAAGHSDNAPSFLYCNPDNLLTGVAERSARIIGDERIRKINLTVGPMALAGSTRMQASTVLMAAVGYALLCVNQPGLIPSRIAALAAFWRGLDAGFLEPFIVCESDCYVHGQRLFYQTGSDLAVTILTDTTERSPTFSMAPFENSLDADVNRSLCFMYMPGASDAREAWRMILGREPRTLAWPHIGEIASETRLSGFDFSCRAVSGCNGRSNVDDTGAFAIFLEDNRLVFHLAGCSHELPVGPGALFEQHLVLKMLLNMHSTLIMGRLGRYDGNIMTWVKPSNYKLIDRTIRYSDLLLRKRGFMCSYSDIAAACFDVMETTRPDYPIVYAIIDRLSGGEI